MHARHIGLSAHETLRTGARRKALMVEFWFPQPRTEELYSYTTQRPKSSLGTVAHSTYSTQTVSDHSQEHDRDIRAS
mgnify:CR=1 FL=1|jgi:hypothetical protein